MTTILNQSTFYSFFVTTIIGFRFRGVLEQPFTAFCWEDLASVDDYEVPFIHSFTRTNLLIFTLIQAFSLTFTFQPVLISKVLTELLNILGNNALNPNFPKLISGVGDPTAQDPVLQVLRFKGLGESNSSGSHLWQHWGPEGHRQGDGGGGPE